MTMNEAMISVIIPVKNEEANLPRALRSVTWADEVFVVDSQSTDRTVEIAKSWGAQVIQFNFNGKWPKKKNWALEHIEFRGDWVFVLDADEVLPDEAEAELRGIAQSFRTGMPSGYWVNRRFMFMGKWLRHAYFPNWNLRFFRHEAGRYEKLTESETGSGDNEVHEHVIIDGSTGRLQFLMDHYAFPSVHVFIEKHNRYSNWEAVVEYEKSSDKFGQEKLQDSNVRFRRLLRQLVWRCPGRPLLRFLYVYFFQLGFLDGREGYYFARLHAVYEFLTIAKRYEYAKQQKQPEEA